MKTKYIKLLIVVLISFFNLNPGILRAEETQYSFRQISQKEGIPFSVKNILTDSRGFLWASTNSGLIRYNGKDIRNYTSFNVQDSLPGNKIYQIIEDSQKCLWTLTDKGLARYIPQYDRFSIPFPVIAHSACMISDGIVFGAENKLYIYRYSTDKIEKSISLNDSIYGDFFNNSVQVWSDNEVICYDNLNGIIKVNIETGFSERIDIYHDKYVLDMKIDENKNFWIAPYNQGLKCYSQDGRLLKHYNTENSDLNCNIILCITPYKGNFWLGTDGGGINILNPQTGKFSIMNHVSADPHSLPASTILCLYNDTLSNDMWAGSNRGGIVNIRKVPMKIYSSVNPGYNKGLSESTVLNIYDDKYDENLIWIGTDGGGVNSMDISRETFSHYSGTQSDKVVSITGFSKNELLISVFSKGLFLFDKKTGIKRPFELEIPSIEYRLKYSGLSVNVYQDSPSSVLILSNPIYRYHLDTKQAELIQTPQGVSLSTMICPIMQDDSCTYVNDMNSIYYIRNNKIIPVFDMPDGIELNSVSADISHNLWLGTSVGLYKYDIAKKNIDKVNSSLFNKVNTVLCDNAGYVWIGTDKNLFSYHPVTGRFLIHDESDGVSPNEYLPESDLLMKNGNIFLGGVNGLLYINRNIELRDNNSHPDIHIAGLTIGGSNYMHNISDDMTIELPYSVRNISIRLMSYGDDIFRTKLYRYQIGIGIMENYKPEIIISSLAPGTYNIKASCNTKSGEWTSMQHIITIVVLPPWYLQWWFLILCTIVIICIIFIAFQYTIRRQRYIYSIEMQEHNRKVSEDKIRFLINVSHELRTPLTLIYGPLERILKNMDNENSLYKQLGNVFRQVKRMRELINMVLDVRKMEMSDVRMEISEFDINMFLKEVANDYYDELKQKNVVLDIVSDDSVKTIRADRNKLVIVLNNFMMNALRHSPDNTCITIKTEKVNSDEFIRISVSDEGIGLKYTDSNRLFSRFYQGANEAGGSGIGLSYSKMLVELHGGTIGAYNNVPGGATFYFDIPLHLHIGVSEKTSSVSLNDLIIEDIHDSSDENKDSVVSTVSLFKNLNILITDDNVSMTDFLQDELKQYFNKIYTASNGIKALESLRENKIDILLSDVMMPLMNGFELCRNLKTDVSISHIPVILLTARTDSESKEYGYKLGADAYISKPFSTEELLNVLYNIVYNRNLIKEHFGKLEEQIPSPVETTFSAADEDFINKVNAAIRNNISNSDLDVALICKEVGVSRASLYNKMKAITDMGAGDYITRMRLDEAIRLIRTTDLTFAEIADRTGFSTARYFSTIFKQHTGKTPTQYKSDLKDKY